MTFIPRRLAILLVGVCMLLPVGAAAADEPAGSPGTGNILRYRDRPLTATDFWAEAAPRGSNAGRDWDVFTKTDLRYQTRFRLQVNAEMTTAELTHIEVYAVVLRDQSWNLRKQDRQLLDHAQGHFDIMQAAALRCMLRFAQAIAAGRPLIGSGPSENAAVLDLDEKIKQTIKPLADAARAEADKYNQATRHGQLPDELAQQRKQQIEMIRSLTNQLHPAAEN